MGRTSGELDNWIVPKRSNVYQTLAFLATLDKYPSYKNFTPANQTAVATKMRKDFGASKAGTMQPQAARTTKALAQYMGFVTTEDEKIVITEIGTKFLNNHRHDLINKGHTLSNPIAPLITEADEWKMQMIKLMLTNPSQPKCEDVNIYPFRFVLRLLQDLKYIDVEEMAMFVLTSKKDTDFTKTKDKILKYRSINYKSREKRVEKFKGTTFGNIALGQAGSANYFMALCEGTGLVERKRYRIVNPGNTRNLAKTALVVKAGKNIEINSIVSRYKLVKTIQFLHDQRKTWDYYYCQDGINYPVEVMIHNKTVSDVLVQVENATKGDVKNQEFVLESNKKNKIYTFPGDNYIAHIYDYTGVTPSANISVSSSSLGLNITKSMLSSSASMTKTEIVNEIKLLCSSKGLTPRIDNQLKMYTMLSGNPASNIKMYRGSYLELYFSMLLKKLKNKKAIDDFESSVKLGAFNIPHAMPSRPDFVLKIGDYNVVLEITLMRPAKTKVSKDMKMEIEGAIRHMKEQCDNYDKPAGKKSFGIFAAGGCNTVLDDAVSDWATTLGVSSYCTMTLLELVDLFERGNRVEIESKLK